MPVTRTTISFTERAELEAAEHPVGGYSLDLVGRDTTNDAVLIVENQLAPTDHSHLGQVLTYAAGTAASTIVWIATAFCEEHRQALDWLNENTGEDVHFFGIELQVVKIGDSPPAPLLNLVAQPNDWQKQVRASTQRSAVTGKGALYPPLLRPNRHRKNVDLSPSLPQEPAQTPEQAAERRRFIHELLGHGDPKPRRRWRRN